MISMPTRRRFFTVIAGCIALPSVAGAAQQWRGRVMGAEARIILGNTRAKDAYRVFERIESVIRQVESQFSLHSESDLARLNRTGILRHPSSSMLEVFNLAGRVYTASGGMFDPTIQPLWLALARGEDADAARQLIGWPQVDVEPGEISLRPGMQLTFNGIAQGHCADRVAALLRQHGFDHVLVETGEIAAIGSQAGGEAWPVSIQSPDGTEIAQTRLMDRAIATSSPFGTTLAHGEPHILSPFGTPHLWNTVSISAPQAAVADALSTAACLLTRDRMDAALAAFPGAVLEAIA